jgi:hypothetical protein
VALIECSDCGNDVASVALRPNCCRTISVAGPVAMKMPVPWLLVGMLALLGAFGCGSGVATRGVHHNGGTVTISGTWACGSSVAALNELTPAVLNSAARNLVLARTHSRLVWSGLHVKILSEGPSMTLVLALDTGMECWVLSDAVKTSTPVAASVETGVLGPRETVFTNIDVLQKAVTPVLPTVRWNDHGQGAGFMGTTDDIELRPGSELSPSTVDYCISSHVGNHVEEAVISAFVTSPKDLPLARAKVRAAAVQWFKTVGKTVPPGILAAIAENKPFKTTTDGMSVEYVLDRCAGKNGIKQSDGTRYRCSMMDLAMKPADDVWPDSSWNCRSTSK